MKKFFLILILLLLQNVNSQQLLKINNSQKIIDSLETCTKNLKSDSLKCLNYLKLFKFYFNSQNQEKATFHLANANKLAIKYQYLKDITTYFNALKYLQTGEIDLFMEQLVKTNLLLKKYDFPDTYKLRSTMYQNYCIMLQRKNNEKEAMRILVNEAIPTAKKSNDDEILAALYKTVAVICLNSQEREKANEYFELTKNLLETTKNKSSTLLATKIETYNFYAENLIELKKFAQARIILNKSKGLLSKYPTESLNSNYFYSEAIYYSKQNNQKSALQFIEKGLKICSLNNDSANSERLNYAKYEALKKSNNLIEAKNILENLIKNSLFVVNKKDYSLELSKTYKKLGNNDKALEYAEKYIKLNDSLNDSKFKNEIVALEAKFNKTENESKIKQLLAQKEKSELLAKNNRLNMILLGLAIAFLLISILFIINYYKNQKKINLQNEENLKQELLTAESQKKLAISDALITGEEVERKRLARDLHDGLGSMLSGLKIHINKLSDENIRNSNIKKIENQLDNSIKELRQIAQNLMPESLLKLGLETALRDLCIKLSDEKTLVEYQFYANANEISESKQIIIYRIVQELLNNAFKYAKASEILVSINQNENILYLTLEDNGKGFDAKNASSFNGMGLKNIKNRVDFLKGKLEIESEINKGTVFNIELKINE